jgi:hypothetical protein
LWKNFVTQTLVAQALTSKSARQIRPKSLLGLDLGEVTGNLSQTSLDFQYRMSIDLAYSSKHLYILL